ncbi:MAG: hypothetical protein JSR44_16130 [Spirochaetes bacterium]|nr:hypothetical protein [Spirochaetota bacterium]
MAKLKQQEFFQCPECSAIVERVFQNGVCRACLHKKLQTVRLVIDNNHALAQKRMATA